jgi:hypothetical protein
MQAAPSLAWRKVSKLVSATPPPQKKLNIFNLVSIGDPGGPEAAAGAAMPL